MNKLFKGKKKNEALLESPVRVYNDNGMRMSVLINLSNYENIRITSSKYDDIEKCFQEIEDAITRIPTAEAREFLDAYFDNRQYRDKLGVFKASHPNY